MMSSLHNTIAILGISFILISAFGLMSLRNNYIASAQNGNATLGILGNNSGVGSSFGELSDKISQLANKLGLNSTLGSNASKASITAFLEKLQSNASIPNLMNKSAELINRSGMNISELTSKQPFNISGLAEKFLQLLKEKTQNR